ncbi:SLC13 family permease [Clostridium sp.]|uniref:SLC13 family permease n=1 Tax=Clostridium sp. TaxID=1506 RepID=UPI002FC85F5B
MIITLIIALIVYAGMVFFTKYRTAFAILGSGVLLLYGTLTDSFPATLAFQKFPTEIFILIVVLSLFTKVFENMGFFEYVGNMLSEATKGRKILISIIAPLIIYGISLFMNNLSAILLCTFICLELAVKLKLPVAPLLVSAIIASNIGGAPLPWADTPAVVLTLYSDFNLVDFLTRLFVPCGIYIGLLVQYTKWWFKREEARESYLEDSVPQKLQKLSQNDFPKPPPPPHHHKNKDFLEIPPHVGGKKPFHHFLDGCRFLYWGNKSTSKIPSMLKNKIKNKEKPENIIEEATRQPIAIPIILFILLIFFICIAPFLNISIAYVSLIFMGLLLFFTKIKPEEILNSLSILDSLMFISALFLIAGVLEYSGVLTEAVNYILAFTNGDKYLIEMAILLCAFVIATFLSAGPAAATLLPICLQLSPLVGDRLVYAALALGILAGSSMLPWSATGGPMMLSEVSRFLSERNVSENDNKNISRVFNLKYYLAFSIPFSLVILILSAMFLIVYLYFQ